MLVLFHSCVSGGGGGGGGALVDFQCFGDLFRVKDNYEVVLCHGFHNRDISNRITGSASMQSKENALVKSDKETVTNMPKKVLKNFDLCLGPSLNNHQHGRIAIYHITTSSPIITNINRQLLLGCQRRLPARTKSMVVSILTIVSIVSMQQVSFHNIIKCKRECVRRSAADLLLV